MMRTEKVPNHSLANGGNWFWWIRWYNPFNKKQQAKSNLPIRRKRDPFLGMVSENVTSKGLKKILSLESPGYGVVLPGFFFTTPKKTKTQNMQMSLYYQPKLHALFFGQILPKSPYDFACSLILPIYGYSLMIPNKKPPEKWGKKSWEKKWLRSIPQLRWFEEPWNLGVISWLGGGVFFSPPGGLCVLNWYNNHLHPKKKSPYQKKKLLQT